MAHGHHQLDEADKQPIGAQLWPTFRLLGIGAAIGLVMLVVGVLFQGENWQGRFFYAYLIGYCFILALTIGSVALVILTHLFRAGWVVAVRRVPETFAANFWIVAILSIPILVGAMIPTAPLYPWSASLAEADKRLHAAEKFIHDRHHSHEHHGDHGDDHDDHKDHAEGHGDAQALVDDATEFYVAANAMDEASSDGDAGSHDGDGKQAGYGPAVEKSAGYDAAAATMAATVYDGADRAENRKIQKAYYTTMLSYMLDYKRYGGQLDMSRDEETGEVIVGDDGKPLKDGQVEKGYGFTWLSPMFFAIRMVLYFAIFSLIGWYFWSRSIKQDETGDPALTTRREWWAPLSVLSFALCVTFMSFDLLMSLDPAWYSTMFGVIFFANSFTAAIAGTILVCMFLQKKGYLKTVHLEHYHDLGKLLFAFVFFWGYVSFSQFMLIWYASFPETAYWFEIHGMTTVKTAPQYGSGWSYLSLLMLFGHLFVPFGFLLSRHVKRNLTALAGAAIWMLLMVYLDFYWYAMPFFESPGVTFGLPEIGSALLLISLVLMAFIHRYRKHAPLAHGDPRLHESTALDTNVWAPLHH